MIAKNFIRYSEHAKVESNGTLCYLQNYEGNFEGYYQEHEIGLVVCDKQVSDYLEINGKRYDVNEIKRINYNDNGGSRLVQLISVSGKVIEIFNYEVFWVDDLDMLEFALELPQDEEKDLLKYITNKLNNIAQSKDNS